jgi:hypothetical protein
LLKLVPEMGVVGPLELQQLWHNPAWWDTHNLEFVRVEAVL